MRAGMLYSMALFAKRSLLFCLALSLGAAVWPSPAVAQVPTLGAVVGISSAPYAPYPPYGVGGYGGVGFGAMPGGVGWGGVPYAFAPGGGFNAPYQLGLGYGGGYGISGYRGYRPYGWGGYRAYGYGGLGYGYGGYAAGPYGLLGYGPSGYGMYNPFVSSVNPQLLHLQQATQTQLVYQAQVDGIVAQIQQAHARLQRLDETKQFVLSRYLAMNAADKQKFRESLTEYVQHLPADQKAAWQAEPVVQHILNDR